MKKHTMIAGYPKSGNNWLVHLLMYNIQGKEYNPDLPNKYIFRTEQIVKPPSMNRITHLIRHPLDVLVSYRNYEHITGRVTTDFNSFIDSFYEYGGSISFGRVSWLTHLDFWSKFDPLVVKYDDLLYRGPETLKKVYEFWGLPTGCEEEALEAMSFKKLRANEDAKASAEDWTYFRKQRPTDRAAIKAGKRFFNRGESFYFPEYLSEEQIVRGYEIFGDAILKYWPEEELTKKYLT